MSSRQNLATCLLALTLAAAAAAAYTIQPTSGYSTILKQWPNLKEEAYHGDQNHIEDTSLLDGRSASTGGYVGKLSRSAPYAIETSNSGQNMKNIVFRLTAPSSENKTTNSQQEQPIDDDPWTFVTKNGTLIGSKANLNLKKLLETLDSNNFTSEVKFDENDTRVVNITISNLRDSNKIDSMLLEEIILDASSDWSNLLNGSSILKDNHRYETAAKQNQPPIRSRPPSSIELLSITSPPIRSSIEVVAENYTVNKIAEEANNFAIKLLHQLNIEKLGNRNLIQAPFSVYQGLALLLMGSMGESAKEMDKALLGSQSVYENQKLTHDPDRPRLLASLSDVIRQLQFSATHHTRYAYNSGGQTTTTTSDDGPELSQRSKLSSPYMGGTGEQHLIVANNLLFSPSAYEISPEFRATLSTYYNNTALTKIEIGSTESVQVLNSWIRSATAGVIPAIMHKKSTFDEFTVMALLCTSWLSQEWRDTFYRISSPLRTSIRLKGQARDLGSKSSFMGGRGREWNLLEFVDDNKNSHFVDYIKSRPTTNIHHYHSVLNGLIVDVLVVPFKDSNHRLVTLTPLSSSSNNVTQQLSEALIGQIGTASAQVLLSTAAMLNQTNQRDGLLKQSTEIPDSSLLTRLIGAFVLNPRKTMRSLWNIISPDIITKQTLQQNTPFAKGFNNASNNADNNEQRTLETNEQPLVQLSIPIIRSEADSSISAALNHIGIVSSFDPNQANFIGINGHPFNYNKLHLSNVISKTTFNLNERGLNYDRTIRTLESLRVFPERQSSSNEQNYRGSIKMDENSIKPELIDDVKLNKPFMYFICDIRTKLILYTGVLRNPEQEGS